jgi:hypothetical protein
MRTVLMLLDMDMDMDQQSPTSTTTAATWVSALAHFLLTKHLVHQLAHMRQDIHLLSAATEAPLSQDLDQQPTTRGTILHLLLKTSGMHATNVMKPSSVQKTSDAITESISQRRKPSLATFLAAIKLEKMASIAVIS